MVRTTVKWHGREFDTRFAEFRDEFLREAGELISDRAASNWAVRTGRGRGSVHFVLSADVAGAQYGGPPQDSRQRLDPPGTPATARIGSGLFYALPYEAQTGWLARAFDAGQTRLRDLTVQTASRYLR